MTMTHKNTSRLKIDLASAALTVIGLVFGAITYCLITAEHANPLVIVPSIVAITVGITHLVKREAPRK